MCLQGANLLIPVQGSRLLISVRFSTGARARGGFHIFMLCVAEFSETLGRLVILRSRKAVIARSGIAGVLFRARQVLPRRLWCGQVLAGEASDTGAVRTYNGVQFRSFEFSCGGTPGPLPESRIFTRRHACSSASLGAWYGRARALFPFPLFSLCGYGVHKICHTLPKWSCRCLTIFSPSNIFEMANGV